MLGVLFAALMAASFFMPWIKFGPDVMGPPDFLDAATQGGDLPAAVMLFFASFPIAGLAAVLGLFGRGGLLMFIAGAIPYGLMGYAYLDAREEILFERLPIQNLGGQLNWEIALEVAEQFLGIGGPAYFASALLLIFIGLGRMMRSS